MKKVMSNSSMREQKAARTSVAGKGKRVLDQLPEMEGEDCHIPLSVEGKGELVVFGYACKFCPKKFPTPQALGGHQKAHRTERSFRSQRAIKGMQNPSSNPLLLCYPGLRVCPMPGSLQLLSNSHDISHRGGNKETSPNCGHEGLTNLSLPGFGWDHGAGLAKPSLPWHGCGSKLGLDRVSRLVFGCNQGVGLGKPFPTAKPLVGGVGHSNPSSTGPAELSFIRHLQQSKDRLGHVGSNDGGHGYKNDTLKKRQVELEELDLSLHL